MAFVAQIIEQGPRNCIVKVTGSGTDSGLAFDASTLAGTQFTRVNINQIWPSIPPTASVIVEWKATADVIATVLNPGLADHDYQVFGGLLNPKAAGWTGSVEVTGVGTGDWTVVFWFVKH